MRTVATKPSSSESQAKLVLVGLTANQQFKRRKRTWLEVQNCTHFRRQLDRTMSTPGVRSASEKIMKIFGGFNQSNSKEKVTSKISLLFVFFNQSNSKEKVTSISFGNGTASQASL